MKINPFSVFKPLACLLLLNTCLPLALAQQAPTVLKPVQVEEIKTTLLAPTIDIVGSVYSRHNVQLTAGLSGRLEWVAEPGTAVRKGDDVARIDPLPLQLQRAEQQAQIKRAKINQIYLKRELARLADLRSSNSASAFQFDQTQSQFDLAQADLEIAELKLKQIDEQLSRSSIKAPFSGVVTERMQEAGAEVNRGAELVQMLDTQNLEGKIFVPVKYLPFVRQVASITVMNDNIKMDVPIKALIPAADSRSQSFELRVTLPVDELSNWTAGQILKARLPVQHPQETLTIHRDALILRQDGIYVMVIDQDNKAHKELVEVGQGQDDWVSIRNDNLRSGNRVAVRGAERLSEGQQVEISPPNA
ncbi:efflux RND transporter periplasmic adaptor subunit [Paraglaciecola hydrolytica]|uniref:RND efflux pump membrane fusion protein barrel-sandwich domain-containing protein n=1 Tax=Paraglaciecola hydrolytica TaxID=1799789 RepID=A0A136A2J5_9ALTE|nr:efflux RND transporter periplasmic adaptor subunit [Paraglaciecola hydrolytica]KXI29434.1 hypothetical protein AX660_15010 [Paraglaciecola hydrolytica]